VSEGSCHVPSIHSGSWTEVRLGDAAQYLNGRGFKTSEWEESGTPIIRIQNLNDPSAPFNYTTRAFEDRYRVQKDDLLFAWAASLGAHIWRKGDAWLNQHIFRVVPKSFIEKRFLYYTLLRLINVLYAKTHGSGMVHITKARFEDTIIQIPPLVEQRAIVAKIDALFSELDKSVEQLQTIKQQLKQYRQAVLKAAFEGKLTAAWRAEQQAAGALRHAEELVKRISTERAERYERKLRNWNQAMDEWETAGGNASGRARPRRPVRSVACSPTTELDGLPALPDGWQWVRLDQLGLIGTGSTPRRAEERYWKDGSIPWVASSAVNEPFCDTATEYITVQALQDAGLKVYPAGTLLLAMYGEGKTRGKVTELRIPATVNQALAAIVLEGSASGYSRFVKYYLWQAYSQTRSRSSGGVQPNLNLEIVSGLAVPCAPESEQEKVIQEIESRLSVIDDIDGAVDAAVVRAETLRAAILKKAFEGNLLSAAELADVRSNSDYEPAKKLLDRILATTKPHGQTMKPQRSRGATHAAKPSHPQNDADVIGSESE
jgi:type I restriction enzyme S subunit